MAGAMMRRRVWSPYLIGALIGALSWASFLAIGKALGVSTSFVHISGMIEALFSSEHVRTSSYYSKYLVGKPAIDWQLALVIAIFFGAMVSAKLGGSYAKEQIPSLWRRRFGDSRALRNVVAFGGGVLVMFGARMAGGCTSGHAISGGLQLALSGWFFMFSLFATGILTARLLYRGAGALRRADDAGTGSPRTQMEHGSHV